MAFTAKTDWQAGDDYPAERMSALEQAVSANEANVASATATADAAKTKADSAATTEELASGLAGKADASHTHTATQISDVTTVGKSVLTAADAAAIRTLLGFFLGTRAELDAGTNTAIKTFTAKDLKEFVDARIAALAAPKV